jgi:hypothetical protein
MPGKDKKKMTSKQNAGQGDFRPALPMLFPNAWN